MDTDLIAKCFALRFAQEKLEEKLRIAAQKQAAASEELRGERDGDCSPEEPAEEAARAYLAKQRSSLQPYFLKMNQSDVGADETLPTTDVDHEADAADSPLFPEPLFQHVAGEDESSAWSTESPPDHERAFICGSQSTLGWADSDDEKTAIAKPEKPKPHQRSLELWRMLAADTTPILTYQKSPAARKIVRRPAFRINRTAPKN